MIISSISCIENGAKSKTDICSAQTQKKPPHLEIRKLSFLILGVFVGNAANVKIHV